MMQVLGTPLDWRRDWTLYRAIEDQDSHGDPIRRYDLEHPDFTGSARTASGVCWQVKSAQWAAEQFGEVSTGGASFNLFLELEIAPFDRCKFGGRLWEVRAVLPRSSFRQVLLVEVGTA